MRLFRLFKREIPKEAQEWVKHGFVEKEQAVKICEHYGLDYNNTDNHILGLNALSLLAYFFMGLSIILLVSHNWEDIPRHVKFSGVLITFLASQFFSLHHYLKNDNSSGNYFLIGNFLFGIGIILIAQIFHLGEYMPDGVFWWALGTLPVGVILSNPIVTLQSLILSCIWFFMETGNYHYPGIFPLFILAGLWVLYKGKASTLLFIGSIFSFGIWFEYSLIKIFTDHRYYFDLEPEVIVITMAFFVFVYSFSYYLRNLKEHKFKDYAALLSLWSLRFGILFLFFTIFKDFWSEFYTHHWQNLELMYFISLIFLSASVYLSVSFNKLKVFLSIFTIFSLPFILLSLYQLDIITARSELSFYTAGVYNLVLIASCIKLIHKGVNEGVSHYFYLGVSGLVFYALIRYFNLFGDFITSAILFIILAFILLSVSKYWKQHQLKLAGKEKC